MHELGDKFKLLHIDIETRPAQVLTWTLRKPIIGVEQIVEPTSLLCFSASWEGEDGVMFYKSQRASGGEYNRMVHAAHKLLDEADAVCHFNGTTFDVPRLNQEFLRLGLPPPKPFQQIDLKKVVMSQFDMISSRLAFVGPYLEIGKKIEHEGWPLWVKCLNGDVDAWQRMEEYNIGDVVLLKDLYHKILPWIPDHPNLNVYAADGLERCTNCGSTNVQHRGTRKASVYEYPRLQCNVCGKWSSGRASVKRPKVLIK